MEDTEITWDQLIQLCRRSIAVVESEDERLHTVDLRVSGETTIGLELTGSEELYCLLSRRHNRRVTWAGASVWVTPLDGGGRRMQMTLYRAVNIATELAK